MPQRNYLFPRIHSPIAPQLSTLQPKSTPLTVYGLPTKQVSPAPKITNYRLSNLNLNYSVLNPFKDSPISLQFSLRWRLQPLLVTLTLRLPNPIAALSNSRADKAIMGEIASDFRDDWSAWTGNNLAPGWFGLYPSAIDDLTSPKPTPPCPSLPLSKQGTQLLLYRHDNPLHTRQQPCQLPERCREPPRQF